LTLGVEAFVAIGSNIDPAARVSQAAQALRARFPDVRFSACYRSRAYGFQGEDFINAVARLSTDLPVAALLAELHSIEALCGRDRRAPRWGSRSMDLDLLLYDDVVGSGEGYVLPRPDLTRRAYMLGPIAELAPERRYPPDGPTMAQLWARFPEQDLQRLALDLNA
jgi:2-amino-4-hydroxy-6-hydroxymethyldihydropteridine diphosphokinase